MRKFIVPVVCVLVGCAAGVAMPTITAQTFAAPSPGTVRYEAFCEPLAGGGDLSAAVARHGQNGFHHTSTTIWRSVYACFERPVQ